MANRRIAPQLIGAVCERLSKNLPVRRTLPDGGRLHVDRQLPFLCVYRQPSDLDDAGTRRLVKGEASYLIASGDPDAHASVTALVHGVVSTLSPEFGAFLIIEVWASEDGGPANDPANPTVSPVFYISAPESRALTRTVDTLARQLRRIKVLKQGVEVAHAHGGVRHPPGMRPLLTRSEARRLSCSVLGLAIPPVYRKANSAQEFPLLARGLRRSLSLALRQSYFEFAHSSTTHRPSHHHALGRRAVVKAVWAIDSRLAGVSNQFDYLLSLSPVNASSAWEQFGRDRFEQAPEFHYRPLPVDPALLKRELYKIPIDRVEDPALQRLFQQKQEELELKLTMLRDRDTPRFLYGSLALFGGVEDDLSRRATDVLQRTPRIDGGDEGRRVNARAFAKHVEREIASYREVLPAFKASARVTNDVDGLIVSRGNLYINADLSLSPTRIEALLAHEVGTHLLTYYNGRSQPFQQLYLGLAGYEQLQEGVAVLSEWLVGGLTRDRLRQLAARVVAVRQLTDGASFVDTFRTLSRGFGFTQRSAYNVTMRVYRGGGLTKDAIYYRGLEEILRYLKKGGDLAPLFVGKIAIEHVPIIRELLYRNVLKPAPLVPRHLQVPEVTARLDRLRRGDGAGFSLVSLLGQGS